VGPAPTGSVIVACAVDVRAEALFASVDMVHAGIFRIPAQ
jgi:hypothetical protein